MTSFVETWTRLASHVKVGIAVGIALIVALAIGLGVWAYRADYQVLFADLAPRDAASMTAELERMKIPYQLTDGGNTILVQKEIVYKTRLKLMGKDLPLHGAVGFEVFNNADFGMTEFVQKVNYQRAIQGELTRTILSIEDIQSVRVHLAIPEQGLFKKATTKPKASVTLAMKQGRVLAPDQVTGIQRLVAASVPDIVAEDVTILDQHGVALTRVASSEAGVSSAATQLDSKRSTEEYLVRKVTQVLDRTFGPGEAIASVDVMLNLDQSRVTTEEVLPAKAGSQEGSPTGVVVRERQTTRDSGAIGSSSPTTPASRYAQSGGVTSTESDYQVGRRVEQVVTAAGSLRRMTIAVVVKKPLNETQIDKLREVVGLAVGFNGQRGDAIVVYSMDKFANAGSETVAPHEPLANSVEPAGVVNGAADGQRTNQENASDRAQILSRFIGWIVGIFLVGGVIGGGFYIANRNKGKVSRQRLSHSERERVLSNIRQWIHEGAPIREDVLGSRK